MNPPPVCVCACVCACVCVCGVYICLSVFVWAGMHLCAHMCRRQRGTSGIALQVASTLYSETQMSLI